MKNCLMILTSLLLCVSCSRKVTQATMQTSESVNVSAVTTHVGDHTEITSLAALLTTAISTRAEIRDSLHTRIHTVTTLDADGNVIGQTRTEDTDRVTTRTEDTDSSAASRVERADSASNTESSARRSASASNDSRRTSTSVSTDPWWTSALRWAATLPILAAILACGVAVIRRLRKG